MMRKAVHQWLVTDESLLADVPIERWISRSALDEKTVLPFVAIAFPPTLVEPMNSRSGVRPVEVFVYDHLGSYVFIDDLLDRISDRLTSVTGFAYEGQRLTLAQDTGRSDDLQDDIFPANVKSASFRVVGGRVG